MRRCAAGGGGETDDLLAVKLGRIRRSQILCDEDRAVWQVRFLAALPGELFENSLANVADVVRASGENLVLEAR